MLIVTELYGLKGTALAGLQNPQVPLHTGLPQNLELLKIDRAQIPGWRVLCIPHTHLWEIHILVACGICDLRNLNSKQPLSSPFL